MAQKLDTGEIVAFGQDLGEVEKLLSCTAVDNPSRIARKGIDKIIKIKDVSFWFDSSKLKSINYRHPYQFQNPLVPYPEDWKNFPAIGKTKISGGMSRDEFLWYLKVWEERARALGAEKTEIGDLTMDQYAVSLDRDEFADHISIDMGPARRAGGGGIWCDGWSLFFTVDSDRTIAGAKAGILESLSAFRDEFNTVARRISGRN